MSQSYYERLSALDASFLGFEERNAHWHEAAVMLFDAKPPRSPGGGLDFDRIVHNYEWSFEMAPRYRQRIAKIPFLDHPVWVDDPSFNAPIYAKPGAVKKTGKFQMPKKGVKPGGPGRVEVAGPHEVTKKEWEEFVAKAMQEVRVAADGKISEPIAFDSSADAADEWVAWNKSRDKK